MDLVAKGHLQEARSFFIAFREDHETMHQRDLQKLERVLSPSHLEEMEFAHTSRQSKVNIKIFLMVEGSIEDRLEKVGGLLLVSDKVDAKNKEGENEENKKRSADGAKQGAPVKKSKKDKVGGAGGKTARPEPNAPMAPRVKPESTVPAMYASN